MLSIGAIGIAMAALVAAAYAGWWFGGLEQRHELAALQKELYDAPMRNAELRAENDRISTELAELAVCRVIYAADRFSPGRVH